MDVFDRLTDFISRLERMKSAGPFAHERANLLAIAKMSLKAKNVRTSEDVLARQAGFFAKAMRYEDIVRMGKKLVDSCKVRCR